MTSPDTLISGAFRGLDELRSAHAALLESIPEGALDAGKLERVREFLRRAAAAGSLIDTAADRKQAQGLLDYWAATLYSQSQHATGGAPTNRLPAEETVLAQFQTQTVAEVAAAADRWFRTLPSSDQDLVRRILLRLVRLPENGRLFQPANLTRGALQQLGSPARVDQLLEGLREANVIRLEKGEQPEDDRIGLRFDALTRSWKEYARWLDQRLRFRDTVHFWTASGRDKSALICDELLEEALDYHDKNDLEREFLTASRDRERHQHMSDRVAKYVFAALAVVAVVFAVLALLQSWRAYSALERARTALAETKEAEHTASEARDALKIAANALSAKSKLVNFVKVIRTLAEIGTADSVGERQIALQRMDILVASLGNDPDFAGLFKELKVDLDRARQGADSLEDRDRIARIALKTGHKLKDKALALNDPDLLNELKTQRSVDFGMTQFCCRKIVETFEQKSFSDADPYVKEFWLLYWGELAMLEGHAVESAMVAFGNVLKEIDQAVAAKLPDASHLFTPQDAKWYSTQQIRQKLSALRSKENVIASVNDIVVELSNKKVPKAEVDKLRGILEKRLIPALNAERNEPIPPSGKPPAPN